MHAATTPARARPCSGQRLPLLLSPRQRRWPRLYHRPSNAPKPVLDIRHVAQNPGLYAQNCIDRNHADLAEHPWRIAAARRQLAQIQHDAGALRRRIREIEKAIAQRKTNASDPTDTQPLLDEASATRSRLAAITADESTLESSVLDMALSLPNLSSTRTPTGSTPTLLAQHGPSPALRAKTTSHVSIGAATQTLDFAAAASTSGWGWYFLRREGALLEHALVCYALSHLHSRGWSLAAPPSIVYAHVGAACGFRPRDTHGESQVYSLAQSPRDAGRPPLVLAGTAEIPLAGMHAGTTLDAGTLPLRTAAASRCYRAEAGARGAETKGLYRVHEFTKVEMFAWLPPRAAGPVDSDGDGGGGGGAGGGQHFASPEDAVDPADAMLDEMLAIQTALLDGLGLAYRVLEMPSADLGASASRKVDVEAFFPGRQGRAGGTEGSSGDAQQDEADSRAGDDDAATGFGEVTSASLCGEYQSRRLGVRARRRDGSLGWPGTANATALAVPRVLAALLETHWDAARGVVDVPAALWPWMMGCRVVEARKG